MTTSDQNWPYDPEARKLVLDRLYHLLPELYRKEDKPAKDLETGDLRKFLSILAGPLAIVRQNIEELHADLFIDTASDKAIALLAQMVGTELVFPDADSNRSDVRGTVSWRRRKGTPQTLEEMAEELLEQLAVLMEGWKRLALTQDLNLLRHERTTAEVRQPQIAEFSHGPLDQAHHLPDLRAMSESTGRYHPKHLPYFIHPTTLFPVERSTAAYIGDHGDPSQSLSTSGTDEDWRYAVHPLGVYQHLRARRMSFKDPLKTDRIPPLQFAAEPGNWFGQDGRFSIRIAGLLAGVAEPTKDLREPFSHCARTELITGNVTIRLLDHEPERLHFPVTVTVCATKVDSSGEPTSIEDIVTLEIDAQGSITSETDSLPSVNDDSVVLIKLSPVGVTGTFFPGATIAITSDSPHALREHPTLGIKRQGFLRGALAVHLPKTWIFNDRWFYVTADGSLADAQELGSGPIDRAVIVDPEQKYVNSEHFIAVGPGSAWPPLTPTAENERTTWIVPSNRSGPSVLHGGNVLSSDESDLSSIESSIVLTLRYVDAGVVRTKPMIRLTWTGTDPSSAQWNALNDDALGVTSFSERFDELDTWINENIPPGLGLSLRFESQAKSAILTPAEVSWTDRHGRSLLIHLPELDFETPDTDLDWAIDPAFPFVSKALSIAIDGSTWWEAGGNARMALGGIAPLKEQGLHCRRQVQWRSLCQWGQEEEAGQKHEKTLPGYLDIDIAHGLFALAQNEPPQQMPQGQFDGSLPPNVTVDFQEGCTAHVGSRPAAREPVLNILQPFPTRIVSRSGTISKKVLPSEDTDPPTFHHNLEEALKAANLETEVIQIEESSFYSEGILNWPSGDVKNLTIQATERVRPVIQFDSWTNPENAHYDSLTIRGLVFGGNEIQVPVTEIQTKIDFCTLLTPESNLFFYASDQGADIHIFRSITSAISLEGQGMLRIEHSVVDGGAGTLPVPQAIDVEDGRLLIESTTVFGQVSALNIEASETIFNDALTVLDRYESCLRFSRVPADSILPKFHQVVQGTPARFVSLDRHHPAYARLSEKCDSTIRHGAEDGGEMGVFHSTQETQRLQALIKRLGEFTPAGLISGLIRVD